MSNQLSVRFDHKPRHSKSTPDLNEAFERLTDVTRWSICPIKPPKVRDTRAAMLEYNYGRALPSLPPQAAHASRKSVNLAPRLPQIRANTTPVLHPPDELFLRIIRRRSASARLEESTYWRKDDQADQEIASRLAFASAVPPVYFDSPPEYAAYNHGVAPWDNRPQRRQTGDAETRRVYQRYENDELFLAIDDTIASFQLTQPTPITSQRGLDDLVSPMNDIDQLYLERRKQQKRQARRRSQQ